MKRFSSLIIISLFVIGCSHSAQTQTQTAHTHDPTNSLLPNNAHGNAMVLAEPFRELDLNRPLEPSETYVASSAGTTPAPDWSDSNPFESISDGTEGDQWENGDGATAEQILGLEASAAPSEPEPTAETVPDAEAPQDVSSSSSSSSSSSDSSDAASATIPSAPSSYQEPSQPSWTDVATQEPIEVQEPTSQLTTEQIYLEASELPGLSNWTVVPFAHFRRGLTHVVVAWPALNSSGETVDATVVGICLQESTDGMVEQCGRRWVVNNRAASTEALESALGGSDYELVSQQEGAPLNDLGPRLSQLASQFVSANSRGDREGARRAALGFVQMLPAEQIAFDNQLAQLLWAAASYDGRLQHDGTTQSGSTATLTFDVRRGLFRVQTIQVTAEPSETSPGQWVVVSY